ncbi:MAG: F0F1 ATP synthase subunit B [Alphaproteobacteria bacterium]
MQDILGNPYLWTGLSLAAIIFAGVKWGKASILKFLDGEITKITDELNQARKLRAEAEQTLAAYQKKQEEALREADAIIAQANREAERLRAAATKDLQESMARHEQQAADRIARAEAEAVAQVRAAAIDLALRASALVLRDQFNTASTASDYTDKALTALPQQLAKKSAA